MGFSNLIRAGLMVYCVFMVTISYGQRDSLKNKVTNFRGWHAGFSPSAVLNIYPGLQMSLDYGLNNNRHIITNEVAMLFDLESGSFIGFRYKPGFDYVYARKRLSFSSGLHLNFRYTSSPNSTFISRANGQYNQEVDFRRNLFMFGINLQLQFHVKVDKKSKIGFGFGFGPGLLKRSNKGLPDQFLRQFNNQFFIGGTREGVFPWIMGLVHLNFSTRIFGKK